MRGNPSDLSSTPKSIQCFQRMGNSFAHGVLYSVPMIKMDRGSASLHDDQPCIHPAYIAFFFFLLTKNVQLREKLRLVLRPFATELYSCTSHRIICTTVGSPRRSS